MVSREAVSSAEALIFVPIVVSSKLTDDIVDTTVPPEKLIAVAPEAKLLKVTDEIRNEALGV
jgi:hypothetical protein